jgi:hypothetical protein
MKKRIIIIACLGAVAIFIALVLIYAVALTPAKPDPASEAYFAAVKFCQRYEPSAKNFITRDGSDYLDGEAKWIQDQYQTNWYATGECDAQNEYGALEHVIWAAHVTHDADEWHCTFLNFGGQTLIAGN